MTKERKKLVREGEYLVEVSVQLETADQGWSPCLSLDDACKLDDAREALRQGDLEAASRFGRVFILTPAA